MSRLTAIAAALLLLTLTGTAACTRDDAPQPRTSSHVVETTAGDVRGFVLGDAVGWRGIPYAAPPVGRLRWRPPQPPAEWEGELRADRYGPACLQAPDTGVNIGSGPDETSEDCLTLNVLRPRTRARDLPVMVFIHGGAFTKGAGSQEIYNSATLAARGVVLVTINYRLGRLGFLAHPALAAEQAARGEDEVANFGLLDQIAALEWVRDNIEGFGGDPGNVTIFGESAGGISVNALMASPRAEGLFHRAVSESGLGREPARTLASARADGARAVATLGRPDETAADLRALPAARLMRLPTSIIDGDAPVQDAVLPRPVAEAFARGEEAEVPYLTGTTDVEWPDFFLEQMGVDPDAARAAVLGPRAEAAVATYGGQEELERHLISDLLFTEPARRLATLHAERAPTWSYRFTAAPASAVENLGGAVHTFELPYVFDAVGLHPFPVEDAEALADAVADYWVAFARTGDPNHDGAPQWPAAGAGAFLELAADGPRAVGRDPWERRLEMIERAHRERGSEVLDVGRSVASAR